MLARVLAMALGLCLSVTSRYYIETVQRIRLVFGTEASLHLSNTVVWKFGYLQK